jgi:hypothetical protein
LISLRNGRAQLRGTDGPATARADAIARSFAAIRAAQARTRL